MKILFFFWLEKKMNRKQKICQSIKWITAVNKRKFFSSSFHFLVDIYLIHWILMKLTLIFFWGGSWTLSFQCEFNDKWKKRTQKSSFESQKQEKILRSIYLRKNWWLLLLNFNLANDDCETFFFLRRGFIQESNERDDKFQW